MRVLFRRFRGCPVADQGYLSCNGDGDELIEPEDLIQYDSRLANQLRGQNSLARA